MKLEVDVTKRRFFIILGVLLVLSASVVVYAAVNKAQPWHSASQVEMADGRSLQEDIGIDIVNHQKLTRYVQGSLYGYCVEVSDTCQSSSLKSPAFCTVGRCGCASDSTVSFEAVKTGAQGDLSYYSCYLKSVALLPF